MKIGIGTVQFGMNYGITNKSGTVSSNEVRKIISLASEYKINMMDTAYAYGSSEKKIGDLIHADNNFNIVTKIPPLKDFINPVDIAREKFGLSLKHLRRNNTYGLMVHAVEDLTGNYGNELWEFMCELKNQGYVKKIGASIYNFKEIDSLLNKYPLDIIQIPCNLVDQRLLQGDQLKKLKTNGVEIHARSVFLQGLLLEDPGDIPNNFDSIRTLLRNFRMTCSDLGISPLSALVSFVYNISEIDNVIVGVTSSIQLQEIIEGINENFKPGDFSSFAIDDEKIINPSLWH